MIFMSVNIESQKQIRTSPQFKGWGAFLHWLNCLPRACSPPDRCCKSKFNSCDSMIEALWQQNHVKTMGSQKHIDSQDATTCERRSWWPFWGDMMHWKFWWMVITILECVTSTSTSGIIIWIMVICRLRTFDYLLNLCRTHSVEQSQYLVLAENRVSPCPVDYHHLPYENDRWFWGIRHFQTNQFSGWWFGTWLDYDFPIILGIVIIPTDSYCSEGLVETTNQFLLKHPFFLEPLWEAFFEDAEALRSRIGVAEEDGDVVAGRRDRWQVAMGVSRAEWKIHHEK